MFTHIHTYMYTHHTHTHTHHSRTHTHAHTHMHTHACTHTHTRAHAHTHAHTHACTHTHMHTHHSLTHACTHAHTHAHTHMHTHTTVILFIAGLLVFPAGMDVPQVQELCGRNSGRFNLGNCELGWAYIVICFGTAMGLIATALAWTPVRWRDRDREQSYSI